jgi:hypothetical protein
MTTKTEKLHTALLARGFKPVDHASARECLGGKTAGGTPIFIWLDKMGGGRFGTSTRKGDSMAISAKTIALLLAGKPSKLAPGGIE